MLIRNGVIEFASPSQQHGFNWPFQLQANDGSDLPNEAEIFKISVQEGDIIVLATDGLLDNMFPAEIVASIQEMMIDGRWERLNPTKAAIQLAAVAQECADDPDKTSPFQLTAEDAGYQFQGGRRERKQASANADVVVVH
jgi:protein phosphatase PTC7